MTPQPGRGLSAREAKDRLAQAGPNEFMPTARRSLWREVLGLLTSPLVVILLFSVTISAALGQWTNATIILLMVLLSAALSFAQTYRSQQAVERLRESEVPVATALRDGAWVAVPRREVVPGDCIRLAAGNRIPADGVILEAEHLHVEQAALTGESLPVEKGAAPGQSGDGPDAPHCVFAGTSVVSGTAIAQVTATGTATRFGQIATRLTLRRPPTEFERGLAGFSVMITQAIFVLVIFVFATSALAGRPIADSLLFAIALAVGLAPEFLPIISTVILGRGAVHMAHHDVIVKNLAAIQNLGSIDILCSDKTGTLTTGVMTLERAVDPQGAPSELVLNAAWINATLQAGAVSPLDDAIVRHLPARAAPVKVREIPFDFERRRVSVATQWEGTLKLITKGAPESVMSVCAAQHPHAAIVCHGLEAEGYRVLAVAWRDLPPDARIDVEDEQGLTLLGFLAFADPPREDAAHSLALLRRDGVSVKIITGDHELVAAHVCRSVGLDPGVAVSGADLDSMTDIALAQTAERATLFARISPAQKSRIVRALKARNHVVGYLGDGINDAPPLHDADVGISVSSAVDVARDAADIVLRERSLRRLHSGILEGRRAFGNVMKYLRMGTSSNFGNMFSMAAASLMLPFLPMLPMQILLNNLLYDVSQIPIPADRVDHSFLRTPQRWNAPLLRRFMIFVGPISSLFDFLTFWMLLRVFHAPEALFHTGWFVESLTTQSLVLLVIRTYGNPLRDRPAPALFWSVLAVVFTGLVLPITPLAPVLGFVPLPLAFYLYLAVATVIYLLLVEYAKRHVLRRTPLNQPVG